MSMLQPSTCRIATPCVGNVGGTFRCAMFAPNLVDHTLSSLRVVIADICNLDKIVDTCHG